MKATFTRTKLLLLFTSVYAVQLFGQSAAIREELQSIKTYPFSDPNPIPVLGINKKVAPFYPYFNFDGYTDKSENKSWKVVTLENELVRVTVLPEVGGKVMGAVEKASGNEFVYLNHVIKFRAIGIRGPWTSGGIEHNFGLDLGHAPWAAAAVDYKLVTSADGSVSCIVGGLDLASRSEWRVNIRLPKDKASFETESLWYNPTPLHHAHLSWENAAFKASNDLQFYFPGNYHIGHDGLVSPWPIDHEGRNLSLYKENNFGESKSYHVAGNARNWFGGYWQDRKFGFGHWAPYSDAPGKKLWIWSLAREGAIWENLLTDTDGQYIEAQSGIKLNQAAERSGYHSPFTQLSLRPLYAETKLEYWFPVKNTEGMSDASPIGTLHVTQHGDSLRVNISPNAMIRDSLVVTRDNRAVYATLLDLRPLQFYSRSILLPAGADIRVRVGRDKLLFASDAKETAVNRPFLADPADNTYKSAQRFFRMAEDQQAMRNYDLAFGYYQQCLQLEPTHNEALCRVAEYYYRSARYEKGLGCARKVLQYNSYDPGANYIYGHLLRMLGRLTEAEEAFGMAVLGLEYRSAAYVALAGINLQKQQFEAAADNASRSIDYNRNNLLAYQFYTTALRKMNRPKQADSLSNVLLAIDPLNHFARFEKYLLQPDAKKLEDFKNEVKNELPHETYLELAVSYFNQGLTHEARQVLEQAPAYPTVYYWLAYLTKDTSPEQSNMYREKAEGMSPRFVFPFRLETIPVMSWARRQQPTWKNAYYLGLLYWANLRADTAKMLFKACHDEPDYAPFYLTRGALFQSDSSSAADVTKDYDRAIVLEPGEWRTWHAQSNFLLTQARFDSSCEAAKQGYKRFAANPVIAIDYARALLNTKQAAACLQVLHQVLVLPQEGAQEGHEIFELANLSMALQLMEQRKYRQATRYIDASKKWPENLGTGSPYQPDNRLQDMMSAYCEEKLGRTQQAAKYNRLIGSYSACRENWNNARSAANNYLSAAYLKKKGAQDQLDRLLSGWKTGQDSLHNWSISSGSSSPEFQWVMAKVDADKNHASDLERSILADRLVTRFRIITGALAAMGQ